MSIKDELAEFDPEWANLEPGREINVDPIPDGKYQANVMEARVEHSKGSGRLQFTIVMTLTSGGQEGRVKVYCQGLVNEIGRNIVKSDLYTMGIDVDLLSSLPDICPMIVGSRLNIALKSKTGKDNIVYQNCYINGMVSGESNVIDPAELDGAPPNDDSGAPWDY